MDVPVSPDPPWWTPPKAARRHGLSRGVIIAAAREILRREGIDALSMRRLATDLDTGPASLYAHVANKDELLELLFDAVLGDVPLPDPDPTRWRAQLTRLWTDTRAVMVANGDIARAAVGRIPVGPHSTQVSEVTLTLLRMGNVPAQATAWAVDVVGTFVTACAIEDSTRSVESQDAEFFARYGRYFGGLPADRFPSVVGLAQLLTTGDRETRFQFGLELLVGGLAALVPQAE